MRRNVLVFSCLALAVSFLGGCAFLQSAGLAPADRVKCDAVRQAEADYQQPGSLVWAKAAEASSYLSESYAVKNILGAPDIWPASSASKNVWGPQSTSAETGDWVEVEFDSTNAAEIHIFEMDYPNCIDWIEDRSEGAALLYEAAVSKEGCDKFNRKPQVLVLKPEKARKITKIRIHTDQKNGGYTRPIFDAVGLVPASGS